jgi:hypothetical protein
MKFLLLLLLAAIIFSKSSTAQSTNASFTGTVTNGRNEPLAGASIEIINESTGFKATTNSQKDGGYQLLQLPLGGPYTIRVSYVGFNKAQKEGYQLNQGDQVVVNFSMVNEITTLQNVVVTTNQLINQKERFGAATDISATRIKNLPLEGRNFNNLINLSPVALGSSLGGQRSGSTNITIDGGNFRSPLWAGAAGSGPLQMSQEAIREFQIVTNAYDVTQGRQSGGAVNAVTKSGTNKTTGTAFVYGWNDALASRYDIRGARRTQDFSTFQWGFSLGGPIIKNKLHYFAAFDRQDQSSPVIIADIQSRDDEARYGIRKDTLEKFLQIAREKYGVSSNPQVGQFGRKTVANTIFARFDWTISSKHKLTFRNNITTWDNPINSDDNSNINLREVYNTQFARSYTGLMSVRSSLSPRVTNEVKLQYQYEATGQTPSPELPGANIPRAIVNVTSPFPTASNPNATTTRTVQLGGQRFTPERTKYNQFQLINNTYLHTEKVNWTFGTDNMLTFLADVFTSELNGRFIYNSMKDFENNTPSRYVREVYLGQGEPWVKYNVLDLSAYGQAEFEPVNGVSIAAGLRWDATAFLTAAAYNEKADRLLGVKTNTKPTDWNNFQPRFQLTWNIKNKNTDILKFGFGGFSAMAMYYNQANNMLFDGLKVASIDVSAPSPMMPQPDFVSYRRDPSTAPGVPQGASYVSTINAMGQNFQIPYTWKTNVSYNKLLNSRLRVGTTFNYAYAINNYVYQERNLKTEPVFRLANEGNRGVFVEPSKIDPASGRVDWQNSRITDELGRVLELESDGEGYAWSVVVDGELKIKKDGYLSVAYTRAESKDNSSYNCCVANTSTFLPVKDDPRALSWGYSDNNFKHKVVANGVTPSIAGFSVGLTFIGVGGTNFTYHAFASNTSVQGNFNDRNTLAFLIDPNDSKTEPEMAKAINAWLENPAVPEYAKKLYRENVGRFAPRNGGENPFAGTFDTRIIKRFNFKKPGSIELSADIFNVANLLKKEWGRNRNIGRQQNIYQISGFDPNSLEYKYRFQSNTAIDPIGGTPWRIQFGARVNF